MSVQETTHEQILKWVNLVQRKPRKDGVDYFQFEDGKKFIVNGNRLKLLPEAYNQLKKLDQFYVHIDPVGKLVMYYGYDIADYASGRKENETDGYMNWSDVENNILTFFLVNIRELTDVLSPYTEVTGTNQEHSYPRSHHGQFGPHLPPTQYPHHNAYQPYDHTSYKERDSFYEKLWGHLKDNKTTKAVDHIYETFDKMIEDNKTDNLDTMLRTIAFDKLNIPTMLTILRASKDKPGLLTSRKDFLDKVKTYLGKIKPVRTEMLLKGLEA